MAHGIQREPDEPEKKFTVVPCSHSILQYLAITIGIPSTRNNVYNIVIAMHVANNISATSTPLLV